MKKAILRKGLVIGVIGIFFGLAFTSAIGNLNSPVLIKKKGEVYTLDSMDNYEKRRVESTEIEVMRNKPYGLTGIFLESRTYNLIKEEIFERLIVKLMNFAHISALSAAIVKDNELVWTKGFGLYDRENDKECNGETIFIAASISKSFTATALMQLYEEGLFDLDDDVNDYLPFSLRNPKYPDKPITFRLLLAHQSSLAREREDLPSFFTRIFPGGLEVVGYPYPFLKDYLTPGGIHYKPQVWTDLPPGEEMYYANIGYAVLGYLVEILSGKSFEDYCSENIFEPLDMKNSSFRLANVNVSRVAVPYDFQSGEYYPILHYDLLDAPAGGLRTSVLDLSHFLIAHMNGGVYDNTRILNEESVEEMHTVQYPSENYKFRYGLGWQIWKTSADTSIGHTGGLFGVTTKMVFRQSDKIGIIFFTNKQIQNIKEMVAFTLIERLLFWKASGFKTAVLQKVGIKETILSNKHLLEGFDINSDEDINFCLAELLLDKWC